MRFVPDVYIRLNILFILIHQITVSLQSLLQIHRTATEKNDVTLCDFLESEYLQEQVESMKEISDFVTNLKRVGEGVGVYIFDRQLGEESSH